MNIITNFLREVCGALFPQEVLPPPDRSTLRETEIINQQQAYIRRLERQQ